jgi:hypothetical protein
LFHFIIPSLVLVFYNFSHGYNGNNGLRNLFILANGDLAFFVGTVAILWNPESNVQRLYTQHTQDIHWWEKIYNNF